MANIYTSIDQLIGRTPLLELKRIETEMGLKAKLIAKLEYGSKDFLSEGLFASCEPFHSGRRQLCVCEAGS